MKSVNLKTFIVLRFGSATNDSDGDFIDNIWSGQTIYIGFLGENTDKIIYYHDTLGTKIIDYDEDELQKSCFRVIKKDGYDQDLLLAVLKSGYDEDIDAIIDFDDEIEDQIFEANESDDVSDYGDVVYCISSKTYNLEETTVDLDTLKIKDDGEELENLSMLYGRIDEDDIYLVGVKI